MPEKKTTAKKKSSSKSSSSKSAAKKPITVELSTAQERRLKGVIRMMPARSGPVTLTVDPEQGRITLSTPDREHRIGPQGGEW